MGAFPPELHLARMEELLLNHFPMYLAKTLANPFKVL